MSPDDQNIEKSGPSAYVGLIPAAGSGSRLPDRELSKEMLPVCNDATPVVAHLLHSMRLAGIEDIIVVLRGSKTDLSDYLSGEEWQDTFFDVKMTAGTSGVPETVALGLQDERSRNVAFGFPDILFEPRDAYRTMMLELESGNSDVILGLFPTRNYSKSDMVDTDKDGRVIDIEIKPKNTVQDLTWILAVWRPAFTQYLLDLLKNDYERICDLAAKPDDNQLGQIFKLAIVDGLIVNSVSFMSGKILDVGTPGDLSLAQSWGS